MTIFYKEIVVEYFILWNTYGNRIVKYYKKIFIIFIKNSLPYLAFVNFIRKKKIEIPTQMILLTEKLNEKKVIEFLICSCYIY